MKDVGVWAAKQAMPEDLRKALFQVVATIDEGVRSAAIDELVKCADADTVSAVLIKYRAAVRPWFMAYRASIGSKQTSVAAKAEKPVVVEETAPQDEPPAEIVRSQRPEVTPAVSRGLPAAEEGRDPVVEEAAPQDEPKVKKPVVIQGNTKDKKKGFPGLGGLFGDKKPKAREESSPESRGEASPKASPIELLKKYKWFAIGGAAVIVILIVAMLLIGTVGSSDRGYTPPGGSSQVIVVPTKTAPVPDAGPAATVDKNFWAGLQTAQPEEKSPGRIGYLTALTGFGIFLRIMLSVFAMMDVKVRLKSQPGAFFFMVLGLAAGWLTLPILNFIARSESLGINMLLFLLLGAVWGVPIVAVFAEKDRTSISAALALFAASLFYEGSLTALPVIGGFFGQQWPLWQGVYSIGGVLTLIWSGRTVQAALTMFIIALGAIAIFMSSQEVGKKKGTRASAIIGIMVVIVFTVTNFALGLLVNWILSRQAAPSVEIILVFEVLRPLLAWVVSFIISMLIGMAMGDIEAGFAENKGQQGMSGGAFQFQNIADFAFLATVVPLFLGVVINLF